jgi:hypothetical protein
MFWENSESRKQNQQKCRAEEGSSHPAAAIQNSGWADLSLVANMINGRICQ